MCLPPKLDDSRTTDYLGIFQMLIRGVVEVEASKVTF